MKKIYLQLVISFLPMFVLAQNLEQVSQNRRYSKVDIVKYNATDTSWIISGSSEFAFDNDIYIAKLNAKSDSSGQQIWKTEFNRGVAAIVDLELGPDGDIFIIVGFQDPCWSPLPSYQLYQFDKNGVLINSNSLSSNFEFLDMFINHDNFVILASKNQIKAFNSIHINTWSYSFINNSEKSNIQQLPNGQIFVFRDNLISQFNPQTGALIQSLSTNHRYESICQKDEWFYFIDTDGIVSSIDTGLNFSTASFNTLQALDEIHNFKILPNGKSIMLGKKNNITTLHTFDTNFSLVHSRDFANSHTFINSFDIGNQQVFASGCVFSHESDALSHKFGDANGTAFRGFANSFIKTFDLDLYSNDEVTNAEFIDLEYDTVTLNVNDCYYGGSLGRFRYINPKIIIKNTGTVPIENILLHVGKPRNCFPFYECVNDYEDPNYININGLNILPGSTESVSIDDISYELQEILPTSKDIFIQLVNDKLDSDFSSNKYTLHIDFLEAPTDPVDPVDTTNNGQGYFKIYPNPAQDFITIEVIDDVEHFDYQIYNSVGQLVQNESNVSIQNTFNINISSLHRGYYIVKVRADTGVEFIERLIKNSF